MSDPNPKTVLVVGAGPTGLVAATELARRRVPVRVVDKAPAPLAIEQSRALGVHAPTMEVFERLGVVGTVAAEGLALGKVALYGRDGRRLGGISLDGLEVPYPFVLSLEQGKIERVLEENLARHGVRVERSVELVALGQDAGAVRATLRAADGGEKEEVAAAYLVGCDGARSTVRRLAGAGWPEGRRLDRYALADARIDWHRDPLPEDEMHMFLSPKGVLVVGRLPEEGRWRVIVSFPPERPQPPDGGATLEALQRQVDVHPEVGALLYDPTWLSSYRNAFRMVDRLRLGRVFLAGDAAHVHSPVGAQGMNTGIQDAFNLGWKLALRLRGIGGEPLLDSYHWEHRPLIADLLRSTEAQELLMEAHRPLTAALRDDLLSFVTGRQALRPALRGRFSRSTVGYFGSPIVAEREQEFGERLEAVLSGRPYPSARERRAFRGAPKAGARAPDAGGLTNADGRAPRRLHEVLSEDERHHLLVFCGTSARQRRPGELGRLAERVGERYGALIRPLLVSTLPGEGGDRALLDAMGEAHRRYGARFECLYLVRPDGYVAFRSQPAQARPLEEFLRRAVGVRGARRGDPDPQSFRPEPPSAGHRREAPAALAGA